MKKWIFLASLSLSIQASAMTVNQLLRPSNTPSGDNAVIFNLLKGTAPTDVTINSISILYFAGPDGCPSEAPIDDSQTTGGQLAISLPYNDHGLDSRSVYEISNNTTTANCIQVTFSGFKTGDVTTPVITNTVSVPVTYSATGCGGNPCYLPQGGTPSTENFTVDLAN